MFGSPNSDINSDLEPMNLSVLSSPFSVNAHIKAIVLGTAPTYVDKSMILV